MDIRFNRSYILFSNKLQPFFEKKLTDYHYQCTDYEAVIKHFEKKLSKEKFLYEHTSANPVSDVHFGNIINSLIGDIFVKISNTKPFFWVNDFGLNFAKLLAGCKNGYALEEAYNNELSKEIIQYERSRLQKEGLCPEDIVKRDYFLNKIKDSLKKLKVDTDFQYYYESQYHPLLKEFLNVYPVDENGRKYIPDLNLILTTSSGDALYVATDILYRESLKDKNLHIIVGGDQIEINKKLLKLIPTVKPIHYPVLKIASFEDKEKFIKMSKRLGNTLNYQNFKIFCQNILKEGQNIDFKINWLFFFRFFLAFYFRDLGLRISKKKLLEVYSLITILKPLNLNEKVVNSKLEKLLQIAPIIKYHTLKNSDLVIYVKYIEELFRVLSTLSEITNVQHNKINDLLKPFGIDAYCEIFNMG